MTVIVAVKDNGRVAVGGDSLSAGDVTRTTLASPKVFRNGPFVIGGAGSSRVAQVIQYGAELPDVPAGEDFDRHLVRVVVRQVYGALKEAGATRLWEGSDYSLGNTGLLLAWKDQVRVMDCDFHVREAQDDYAALGSGRPYAEGSLFSTEGTGLSPEERVRSAIRAAAYHSTVVAEPIHVLVTGG